MADVVNLDGTRAEAPSSKLVADQVELLENLIARVRQGDVAAIATVFVTVDGRIKTNWRHRSGIAGMALDGAIWSLLVERGTDLVRAPDPVPGGETLHD